MADRTVIFLASGGVLQGVSSTADNVVCNGVKFNADAMLSRTAASTLTFEKSSGDGTTFVIRYPKRTSGVVVGGVEHRVNATTVVETDGAHFDVYGGNGGAADTSNASGAGGMVRLWGGTAGAASATQPASVGGYVNLEGGLGGAGSAAQAAGEGGYVTLTGGSAGTNNGGGGHNGGQIILDAGDGSGNGNGGDIQIGAGGGSGSGTNGIVKVGTNPTSSVELGNTTTNPIVKINTTNGSLRIGSTGDVEISRGAANRLDLTSGDSLRIVNGWIYGQKFQVDPDDGATATVGGNVLIYTGAGGAAGGGSPGGASGDFTLTLGAAGAGGTGAPAESAGVGGQIVLTAGTGGAGNVAPNAHAGNLGGLAWLKAGVGGAGTAVTAAGGGGSAYVTAGDGGANAGGGGAVGGSLYLNAGQGTGAFTGGSTYLRAGWSSTTKGPIYIGDAYTGAIYISSTLDNPVVRIDSQTGALVFSNSADVQLSRNSADRLDLATGDSFNIVNGNLLFANVVTIDSGRHATFTSDATDPGVNVGAYAGDPSALSNGDIWYNSSTGKFRGYQNGAATDLISGGGATGWSYSSPETYLTTSGDEVTVGASGGTLGKFTIRGDTTTQICQVIRTVASQTADVITTQNSAGTNQVRLTISNEFIPATDNTGSVGTNGNRWALIRGTVVTSGDLNLENDDKTASWTIREMPDHILAINQITGKKYKLAMEPVSE